MLTSPHPSKPHGPSSASHSRACQLVCTNDHYLSPKTNLHGHQTSAKQALTCTPTVSFLNLDKPTRLCTDASRQGLGLVLQQKDGSLFKLASLMYSQDMPSLSLEFLAVACAILVVDWCSISFYVCMCHQFPSFLFPFV